MGKGHPASLSYAAPIKPLISAATGPMSSVNSDTPARWQFATTTIYHFLFVPLSIGLTLAVAVMQTTAYRGRSTDRGAV